MSVGIRVGSIIDEIGSASFVHAFFSTVTTYCEKNNWGTRFPHSMNELYQGHLPASSAVACLAELRKARLTLAMHAPSEVIWDIENANAKPPWGENLSPTITSLANYFVSGEGRDVFELLEEAIDAAARSNRDAILGNEL